MSDRLLLECVGDGSDFGIIAIHILRITDTF